MKTISAVVLWNQELFEICYALDFFPFFIQIIDTYVLFSSSNKMTLIDNVVTNDIITGRIPMNVNSLIEAYQTVILRLQELRILVVVFIKPDLKCSEFF